MTARQFATRWFLQDKAWGFALLILVSVAVPYVAFRLGWWADHRSHETRSVKAPEARRYIGSIVVPTARADICQVLAFDNRTGRLREIGYSKCDDFTGSLIRADSPETTRLREVGKAFRRAGG